MRIERDWKGRREGDGRIEIGEGRKGREGCLPIRLCSRLCMTRGWQLHAPQLHHLGGGGGGRLKSEAEGEDWGRIKAESEEG